MAEEVRCEYKLHGIITDDGRLEVKCDSSYCGHRKGTAVLHYFDLHTGKLVETRTFKDPSKLFKKKERAGAHNS